MKRAAIAIVLAGGAAPVAWADPAPADDADAPPPVETLVEPTAADLAIKQLPTKLKMRPPEKSEKSAKKVAQATTPAPAEASTSSSSGGEVGYKMFPTTKRDLQERVTFRIRAGIELDTAPASGEVLRGGQALPPGFTDTRPWIMGDAVVGARGIIVPSLGGYLLSSFAFDANDTLATRAGQIYPADATGQQIAIKAGYAEYGHVDRLPDDQQPSKFWLRAGRQFRLDGGNMFAYFDGATVGYKEKSWNVSAFAGQRVVLYVDSPAGILYGATAAIDLKPSKDIPLKAAIDFLGLTIDPDGGGPGPGFCLTGAVDGDGTCAPENRQLLAISGSYKFSKQMKLDVRTRFTGLTGIDPADPTLTKSTFALGRAGARLRYETGNIIVTGDLEERLKDDIAYDLATPSKVDIVNIAERLGVGLSQPADSTVLGVQVDWRNQNKDFEVLGFAHADLPSDPGCLTAPIPGQPCTGTLVNVDQLGYFEGGVGVAGTPIGVRGSGVYTTAQYTFRQYLKNTDDANGDGIPDNEAMGSFFGDASTSGVDQMHQLAVESVLATKAKDGKRWRFAAGGYFRVYNYSTPYREVTNDARAGGQADLQYWFNRDLHVDVAGEVAQSSPTLSRELGVLTSLRAALEARW